MPVWISLPELPWHCYYKEILVSMLTHVGKVLYLDNAPINKTRGSMERVRFSIGPHKS